MRAVLAGGGAKGARLGNPSEGRERAAGGTQARGGSGWLQDGDQERQ